MKRNKSQTVWLPPARVLTMIVMLAVVMGALFSAMLGAWIPGMAVGLAFAAAFYLLVIVNARRATRRLKRHKKSRG